MCACQPQLRDSTLGRGEGAGEVVGRQEKGFSWEAVGGRPRAMEMSPSYLAPLRRVTMQWD